MLKVGDRIVVVEGGELLNALKKSKCGTIMDLTPEDRSWDYQVSFEGDPSASLYALDFDAPKRRSDPYAPIVKLFIPSIDSDGIIITSAHIYNTLKRLTDVESKLDQLIIQVHELSKAIVRINK